MFTLEIQKDKIEKMRTEFNKINLSFRVSKTASENPEMIILEFKDENKFNKAKETYELCLKNG